MSTTPGARLRLWCLPLAILSVAACDDTTGPRSDDDVEGAMVMPGGAGLSLFEGAVVLDVPAGAVDGPTLIVVRALEAGTEPSGAVRGSAYEFGPAGLTFDVPVTLTLRYDAEQLGQTGVELLRLHRVIDGVPELVIGSLLDAGGTRVRAEVDHFSTFLVMNAAADALLDGLVAMMNDDAALDHYIEAIRQDLAVLVPLVNSECIATPVLSVKKAMLNQIATMQQWVDVAGLEDLVMSTAEFCGGLLENSEVLIEPTGEIRVAPKQQRQLTARMFGPGGQELVGEVGWLALDPSIASISPTGALHGVAIGRGYVTAASLDLPEIAATASVLVAPDRMLVEVSPHLLTLPMGRVGGFLVTVTDTAGTEVNDLELTWRVLDEDVATVTGFTAPYFGGVTTVGRGVTTMVVCVEGMDDRSCGQGDVEVVYNVQGTWRYEETLTVDIDPPARETCTVSGTMIVTQDSSTYRGTAEETATCTFYPGDGSDPTTEITTARGQIINGRITGDEFYHEGLFESTGNDEACRSFGRITGAAGLALEVVGTVECLDAEDYESVGTTRGTWVSGPR